MTWLDFATIFSFIVLISLAYKRGVVLEVTDVVCLIIGGIMSFRLFRPIANFMHNSVFSGWSITFLNKLCITSVFICTCLVVFSLGLTVQRRAKEENYLEKDTDQYMGLAVGFFKAALLIAIGLGLMFYNDLFPVREHHKLKSGPAVSMFISAAGTLAAPIVYMAAPSDLAKEFMSVGLGPARNKEKQIERNKKRKQKEERKKKKKKKKK